MTYTARMRWRLAVTLASMLTLGACDLLGEPEAGSLLEGGLVHDGPPPPISAVTYTDAAGATVTVDRAFEGWASLIADPGLSVAAARALAAPRGGTVIDGLPRIGVYSVAVEPAELPAFVLAMHGEPGVRRAAPAGVVGPFGVTVIDRPPNPEAASGIDCTADHGDAVAAVAARGGAAVEHVDAQAGAWELAGDWFSVTPSITRRVVRAMEAAAARGERQVINLSVGLDASEEGAFLLAMAQALEVAPDRVRDNTIVVAAPGNDGADLTQALRDLQRHAPDGAARMAVVGATEDVGAASPAFRHAREKMVFARAVGVDVDGFTRCDGTSFAAPEVARVLEQVWREVPALTSAELIAIFEEALPPDRVVPADAQGRTTGAFIDALLARARSRAGEGAPGFELPRTYAGTASVVRTLTRDWDGGSVRCERVETWQARLEADGTVRVTGEITVDGSAGSDAATCIERRFPESAISHRGTFGGGAFAIDVGYEGSTVTWTGTVDERTFAGEYEVTWSGVIAGFGDRPITKTERVVVALAHPP